MGKDLRGKSLPTGITQRRDKRYSARFTTKNGKRKERYFNKEREAVLWLNEAKYNDRHSDISSVSDITVNQWFEYWISNIKKPTVRNNTLRNYRERYQSNIKSVLGSMKISEVRPLHCQAVLNNMIQDYKGSTIEQVRITMCSMFYYASINSIIQSNPVNKMVKNPKKIEKTVRFLTKEEQRRLLKAAEGTSNAPQFQFVLQTGIRTGELMGLKWSDIDFEGRVINIKRTLEFRYGYKEFVEGEPKTINGFRTIPLTQAAFDILLKKHCERDTRKVADEKYKEYVFLNRKGMPTKNSAYDTTLYKLAAKAGITRLSMHTLRHSFASRCIEAGMKPKVLQSLLGHSSILITMNLYVHNSEEEKMKEIKMVEDQLMNLEFEEQMA